MDYYAFLDSNNVVTEVIPGKDQGSENTDWEQWYGDFRGQVCKRCRTDGFRKNYAGVGYTYDPTVLFSSATTCVLTGNVS
jgi:hypothetical protein